MLSTCSSFVSGFGGETCRQAQCREALLAGPLVLSGGTPRLQGSTLCPEPDLEKFDDLKPTAGVHPDHYSSCIKRLTAVLRALQQPVGGLMHEGLAKQF